MVKHKKQAQGMSSLLPAVIGFSALGLLAAVLFFLLKGNDVVLLNPRGLVANEQHRLLITSTLIMLGLAVPTLALLYFFAWKYRDTSPKAIHNPGVRQSRALPFVLWTIPLVVLVILASLMLPATQRLEPQRPIESDKEQLTIQVVALRWKWLFIYPEQNIATVNYVKIPVDVPVQFELTADETPMSSFWIPHLGGQLYAMTEHVNRLNLMADTIGEYQGSAAEINGAGFAGMRFMTHVTTQQDFDTWVTTIQSSPDALTVERYADLLKPSENNPPVFFREPDVAIYNAILSKYAGSHGHPDATDDYTHEHDEHEHGGH